MSTCRENVTWQSADGTWSCGHYTYFDTNLDDPDRDYEWDVEYDFSSFHWASTGHRDSDAAEDSWDGSNPGGTTLVDYSEATAATVARLDQMVSDLRARLADRRNSYR